MISYEDGKGIFEQEDFYEPVSNFVAAGAIVPCCTTQRRETYRERALIRNSLAQYFRRSKRLFLVEGGRFTTFLQDFKTYEIDNGLIFR